MATEDDDERHRREQADLRAKRKAAKASRSISEKDRKRREHTQRVLQEQNKHKRSKPAPPKSPKPSSSQDSSVFESLFTQRAQGFRIDFAFRNAPPRPPVGPCFVGLGLEGELHDSWTRYKPMNAVEVNYTWKLHSEPDLGVPLAPSAMDPSCYQDPTELNQTKTSKSNVVEDRNSDDGTPILEAGDEALLNWTGSLGDSAAEQLKLRKDRERAAARLALAGKRAAPASKDSSLRRTTKSSKKAHSRVLNEPIQSWMKKTTYLSNDYSRRVHAFTSLAETKEKTAQDLETKKRVILEQKSGKAISKTFEQCLPRGIRQHPNPAKRHLKPVADIPLLPNAKLWGAAYTHVVLDNPPKEEAQSEEFMEKLQKAFVADVAQKDANQRMTCQLLVPDKQEDQDVFRSVQEYDLEVLPLKDEDQPHLNFAFLVNAEDGTATYLPTPSRVMLSTGRPAPRNTPANILHRRAMDAEEVKDMELRIAEVDEDFAKKHDRMHTRGASKGSAAREAVADKDMEIDDDDDDDDDDEEEAFGTSRTIVAEG